MLAVCFGKLRIRLSRISRSGRAPRMPDPDAAWSTTIVERRRKSMDIQVKGPFLVLELASM